MDQRREPRRSYFARIVLRYINELGKETEVSGMIEDRSGSGLGVRVGRRINPGCTVLVKHGSRAYSGVVRRCSTYKFDFFIGIELDRNPDPGA